MAQFRYCNGLTHSTGRRRGAVLCLVAFVCLSTAGQRADAATASDDAYSDNQPRLSSLLPPSVADNLDVNAWGWLSYLHSNQEDHSSYWDADLAVGGTLHFGDRVAATADVHFIDDNNFMRGWLEQAFVTAKLSQQAGTLITVGKFNALFGAEPRNAWDRFGGTTSLLFGAEPQDLVGVMVTQPIGDTHLTLRPFAVNQFQGHFDFDQSPSFGIMAEYRPTHELSFAVTNWVGRGFVPKDDDDEYASSEEYAYYGYRYAVGNWVGPRLSADSSGTLYFVDARATWLPRPDLTLAAEGLLAMNGPSAGHVAWGGLLALVNYDITDRWRAFGRWSFLNDARGIVTGVAGRQHELSAGIGFEVVRGLELRGEYRHDFNSTSGDFDSLSAHLTFAY
ncbi:MAG TPA: outer membrane beta-barrel protein [Tepidisphaeraceae bacterium]|nr:outer membrane beta-barrel protein [Tepidisphaeraceae bacterium]